MAGIQIRLRPGQYIALVLVGGLIYFIVVPFLWSPPSIQVTLPREGVFEEDLPVKVVVSAWHSNFVVTQVRFYVDYAATTAHGPNGPFYPTSIYEGKRKHHWSHWNLSRITWKHSKVMNLEVPLSRLAKEGVVKPGIVKGKIDVSIDYVKRISSQRGRLPGELGTSMMPSVPFEIRLR